MKFTCRLVAGLSVVLPVAVGGSGVLRAAPQLPTGMSAMVGDGFVDLSHEIARIGTVVAIGNLTGIRDGKKERLDDAAIDKGADPQKAFHARATDVFRVAARKVELEETIEAAKFAHRQGRTADAKKLIDSVLAKKVDLVDPTHRGWLSRAVTPLEQAARELRESFDAPK